MYRCNHRQSAWVLGSLPPLTKMAAGGGSYTEHCQKLEIWMDRKGPPLPIPIRTAALNRKRRCSLRWVSTILPGHRWQLNKASCLQHQHLPHKLGFLRGMQLNLCLFSYTLDMMWWEGYFTSVVFLLKSITPSNHEKNIR